MDKKEQVSDQTTDVGDSEGQSKKDTVQYDTYKKLLGEKKQKDQKVKELEAKLSELENEKLEKNGDFQKQNDLLKKQVSELATEKDRLSKSFAWNSVQSQIKTLAAQSGCVDLDALVKLGDWSTVEIDQNFNVDDSQVKTAIESSQKKYPYLFKKQVPGVKDKSPSNGSPNGLGDMKDLKKMSVEQLKNLYTKVRTKEGFKDV